MPVSSEKQNFYIILFIQNVKIWSKGKILKQWNQKTQMESYESAESAALQAEPKLIQIMSDYSLCLCRMSCELFLFKSCSLWLCRISCEFWDFTNISHFALSAPSGCTLSATGTGSIRPGKGIVDTMLEGHGVQTGNKSTKSACLLFSYFQHEDCPQRTF